MLLSLIFSITQILREINFRKSRSAKSAIFTHSEGLKFGFKGICTLSKMAVLELLNSPKLISDKICLTEKSWKFPFYEMFTFTYFI